MQVLTKKEICSMGTARKIKLQKFPLKTKKETNKSPRGTLDVAYSNDIIVQKWKDNIDGTLMFNFCNAVLSTSKRYNRVEKQNKNIQQPNLIKEYNIYIGYVDVMDQRVSTYRTRIRQRKQRWPLFTYMVSLTVSNAHILMVEQGQKIKILQFMQVLWICKIQNATSTIIQEYYQR